MKKRALLLTAVIVAVTAMPFALTACNKDDKLKLTDIFQNTASFKEFKSSKLEMTLPEGWTVATDSSAVPDSDLGYLSGINAFVITKGGKTSQGGVISVMKCGAKDPMFSEDSAFTAVRAVGNLLALKSSDSTVTVYNTAGKIVLSRTKAGGFSEGVKIDTVIKILDDGLIAVNGAYETSPKRDANGNVIKIDGVAEVTNTGIKGYTSIYRPTTAGDLSDRGQLVARVRNETEDSGTGNPLSKVKGFDHRYVSVTGNKVNSKAVNRVFTIPYDVKGDPGKTDGKANAKFTEGSQSDYYAELTYIGGGRFYVHEHWTVGEEDDYTYYYDYDESYYKLSRSIYNAEVDLLSEYESTFVFINLINQYYDSGDKNVKFDTKSFLNPDYMYTSFGLALVENPVDGGTVGVYDQFILDADLNPVMSLSGNFNVKIENQNYSDISAFDLIMRFKDGKGYMPLQPSTMRVYDADGKRIFENNDNDIEAASMNDNMIIATILDDNDETKYGIFDMSGKLVTPFDEYLKIDMFRGYYTIGERPFREGETAGKHNKNVLIGKDGKEITTLGDGSVPPLNDIALTESGAEIHKAGCYMFYETVDGTKYYGIKNLNVNVSKSLVMPATMTAGCTLYAPESQPENVFVFEKIKGSGDGFTYKVHRLI